MDKAQWAQKFRPAVPSVTNHGHKVLYDGCSMYHPYSHAIGIVHNAHTHQNEVQRSNGVHLPIHLYWHSVDLCIVDLANGYAQLFHFRYTLLSSVRIELSERKLFDKKNNDKNNLQF